MLEGREVLDDGDPPPAAREHEPKRGVVLPVRIEERRDLLLERLPIPFEEDAFARALEPVQMVLERERLPAVELQHLEPAVATQESLVHDRDPRVADGTDLTVYRAEEGARVGGLGHRRLA